LATASAQGRTAGILQPAPFRASAARSGTADAPAALANLAEAVPAFIWRADARGLVNYVNQRALRSFGVTREEALGEGWLSFVHPDDVETTRRGWQRGVDSGEPYAIRRRFRYGDRQYRWFLIKGEPVCDETGRIVAWCGVLVDMAESRMPAVRDEPAKSTLECPALPTAAAELAAAIIHEVTQPLSAMLLNTRAGQKWLAGAPADVERAKTALEKVARDGETVIDVMHRTRALYQNMASKRIPTDLAAVLRQVAHASQPECRSRGIHLRCWTRADLPKVMADPVQMRQVVANLIRNAIEALGSLPDEHGKAIALNCDGEGEDVRVEIVDTADGVPDPVLVFDPFFTTKANGMGMGLAICRLIVDAHGGELLASNNSTGGSTFAFVLPGCSDPGHR
jgi:PAS domain S-box-containing protein